MGGERARNEASTSMVGDLQEMGISSKVRRYQIGVNCMFINCIVVFFKELSFS